VVPGEARTETVRWAGRIAVLLLAAAVAAASAGASADLRPADILAGYDSAASYAEVTIRRPLDGAVFPPEMPPPTFRWDEPHAEADAWLVTLSLPGGRAPMHAVCRQRRWTPTPERWTTVKESAVGRPAEVRVLSVRGAAPRRVLSEGRARFRVSKDEVGAPLFYREVNLPFVDAVKDPSHIRWRFGPISASPPPVVLKDLPVCGNCHSFPSDGSTLAMDVDYANSKGSYAIAPVAAEMTLAERHIITWNDYRREDGEQTFGLLSQISPDGRYVVSTVKDKSVFVPKPGLEFSQLFFPIKGILCVYDRRTGKFQSLPGADDPRFVQSNPTWSPDGRSIIFARTEAYDLKHTSGKGKVLLTREECKEFLEDGKPFRFSLYRIPFNGGAGGEAEPVPGASHNGLSNYFPKFSPDGRWIVFCRARSYMLLQPDADLYIIPAEGGVARRLRCNTPRMNSWHSWSPSGRWLVFASKAGGPYTQMWLTHVDEQGRTTPPVALAHMTAPDRAVNIPEFVNVPGDAIRAIREAFLSDYSFVRAGNEFFRHGEADNAIAEYRNALELNPDNFMAHLRLGFLLYHVKSEYEKGMVHYRKALGLKPKDPRIHYDLGMALLHQKEFGTAAAHLGRALSGMPEVLDEQYNLANTQYSLGRALYWAGRYEPAVEHLSEAARLRPDSAEFHYALALAQAGQGRIAPALRGYAQALSLDADLANRPTFPRVLAGAYAREGRFSEALAEARKALVLARRSGHTALARQIEAEIRALADRARRPSEDSRP